MAKAAQSEELKAAFEKHEGETKAEVERLEQGVRGDRRKAAGQELPRIHALWLIIGAGSEKRAPVLQLSLDIVQTMRDTSASVPSISNTYRSSVPFSLGGTGFSDRAEIACVSILVWRNRGLADSDHRLWVSIR
jgi:hypothetical protein